VSLGTRDLEAFALASSRTFADAYLASFALEAQTRRLVLGFYGPLRRGDRATYLGTVTFFGTSDLRIENASGAFPDSVRLASVEFAYDDDAERGSARARGADWSIALHFDGLAYDEHAAVVASFADEGP
jgi:hypothetical protein